MASPKKVCRLCLTLIPDEFERLGTRAGILKTISLDLDLGLTDQPLVCFKCRDVMLISYDFKTNCLSNNDYLKSFLHSGNNFKLNLEEIVQRDEIEIEIKREEEGVCRLCLKYYDVTSFVKLENLDEDIFLNYMLRECLPEIEVHITNRPLMCYDCLERLQNLFNFTTTCLNNEEVIKNYIQTNGLADNSQIDLNNVLPIIDKLKSGNVGENLDDTVKKEQLDRVEDDEFLIKMDENNSLQTECSADIDTERKEPNNDSTPTNKQCPYCPYVNKRNRELRLHVSIIHEKHTAKTFNCDKCKYKAYYRSHLNIHLRTHQEDAPFQCPKCSKRFNQKGHFNRHILSRHKELHDLVKKSYDCKYCGFKCTDSSGLCEHLNSNHFDAATRKFQCDQCPYAASEKQHLKRHLHVHSGVKPFVCVACDKSFTQKGHLDVHILGKHENDEALQKTITNKISACKVCSYRTIGDCRLKRHMRNVHESSGTV